MSSKDIVIGITGTGSLVGQAIIKSIKNSIFKDKVELIGMDYFTETVGSFWCNKNYVLPDLLNEKLIHEWLYKIIDIITENKIQILFIGVDFELIHFAIFKEKIEQESSCRIVVSRKEVIEIADDKYLTFEFLKKNKLNFPETFIYDYSKNIVIEYPCIIKPRIGFRSRGVYKINSEQELKEKGKKIKNTIVQELVGDENSEYTCGVVYLDKLIGSIVLKRKLKEGNTSIAEYEENTPQIIYDYVEEIADNLKPFGACNFQLRIDKNGIPKLFEINARHSGTTYIRSLFGFNEVELIIGSFLNIETPSPKLKEGKVIRFFDEFYIPNR